MLYLLCATGLDCIRGGLRWRQLIIFMKFEDNMIQSLLPVMYSYLFITSLLFWIEEAPLMLTVCRKP